MEADLRKGANGKNARGGSEANNAGTLDKDTIDAFSQVE